MGTRFQAPRGTFDIVPPTGERWAWVEDVARRVFHRYGFREIRTPIFEVRELFERSVGETTDIVEKQMYVFQDKGGDWMALRPEGTASVLRAFVEHHLEHATPPYRYFYIGPMFRYERPQKGRFRQFHQIGVEVLGESAPEVDVEIIAMAQRFLFQIQVEDVQLEINSIGCTTCRLNYQRALRDYLTAHREDLCRDCQRRLERNPMRVLDCKEVACQPTIAQAPTVDQFWCNECRDHFRRVLEGLESLDIPYSLNPRLVRGLDYYVRTTFEFTAGRLGAQNAVLGGGRYDGLLQALGGPDWPGLGFAIGVERLIACIERWPAVDAPVHVVFLPLTEAVSIETLRGAQRMRDRGWTAWCRLDVRSLKSGLRSANRVGARFAVLVGEDEQRRGVWTVRDMKASEQWQAPPDEAIDRMVHLLLESSKETA